MYSALADGVLVLHFTFVVFVVLGGLLVLRWPRMAWLHVPAAAWGIGLEFAGWFCPITPLENWLRELAGDPTYQGDFIARYLLPVIYPEGLTRDAQMTLGLIAVVLNGIVYAIVLRRRRNSMRPRR